MKRKYFKNAFLVILLFAVVVFVMYCLSQLFVYGEITMFATNTEELDTSAMGYGNPLEGGGTTYDWYLGYDTSGSQTTTNTKKAWGMGVGETYEFPNTWTAVSDTLNWGIPQDCYNGESVYCIEPGTYIGWLVVEDVTTSDGSILKSYETVSKMDGQVVYTYKTCSSDRYYHADEENWITNPIYTAGPVQSLGPAASFIATILNGYSSDTAYDWYEAQKAIWNLKDKGLDDGLIIGNGTDTHDGESIYDDVVESYAEYYDNLGDDLLALSDETDEDDLTVKVDQTTEEYTIGPFKMSYKSGIYGDFAFSGISDMYCVGYDAEGNEVVSRIEIKEVLVKNSSGKYTTCELSFIDQSYSNDFVDMAADQSYPEGDQEFQIVIDNPNTNGVTTVAYVKLKVKFQLMGCKASYQILTGVQYTLESSNYQYDIHVHWTTTTRSVWTHSDTCINLRSELGYYVCEYSSTNWGCGYESTEVTVVDYTDYINQRVTLNVVEIDQQTIAVFGSRTSTEDTYAGAWRGLWITELTLGDNINIPSDTDSDSSGGGDTDDSDGGDSDEPFGGGPGRGISLTMDLGGTVWEDGESGKESTYDGVSTTADDVDTMLANIKVTLYESDGTLAELLVDTSEGNINTRINPTLTDENGDYLFEGLDPMKDYYVTFEYNGLTYLPTDYTYDTSSYNVTTGTDALWYNTSKATETVSVRDDFDDTFAEIGSYPENYESSNSLGHLTADSEDGKYYNATYSTLDLMGYTLDSDGNYTQTGTQLIDGYLYDSDGNQTDTWSEGVISTKIKDYITTYEKYPTDSALLSKIYKKIAGSDEELWRMLQFIEDCQIEAVTQSQGSSTVDLYPIYDKFIINRSSTAEYTSAEDAQTRTYTTSSTKIGGVTYKAIYPGQFYINLGLYRRQEYDAAVKKDIYQATVTINGKTTTYEYEERSSTDEDEEDDYWEINVRVSDSSYYNTTYTRELYKSDYSYTSSSGGELEVYITYKITVRNQSQSTLMEITELVDYYDTEYTYRDDLSWIMYKTNSTDRSSTIKLDDDDFYEAMSNASSSYNSSYDISNYISNARDTGASTSSKYNSATVSDVTSDYEAIYIQGLQNKKFASGEVAYIYLTFQVNKDSSGVILDDASDPKINIAEINGYTTYYSDNTTLPNGVTKSSSDVAGLLDTDSNPGNLVGSDLEGDNYEKNFEDDTDEAGKLRVIIDEDAVRYITGTVWEDERTVTEGSSLIGDGIRQSDETTVEGVMVQLVEILDSGETKVWYTTYTDSSGTYTFSGYIPGDYVVRFTYGAAGDNNTYSTVAISGNDDYSYDGANDVSYNGQDYKSTTYQAGITQSGYTDADNTYKAYTNTSTQNESATWGYDIYASDSNSTNYSDAKDIWSRRQTVNSYSTSNVTNHVAEVLASPYDTPSYNGSSYSQDEMDDLIEELASNTYMIAETGVIVAEVEYDRQQTGQYYADSDTQIADSSNATNGTYVLADIDFGLTERAKAQLEIDKSITNITVTLANGNTLFDVSSAGTNVIWQASEEYDLGSEKNSKGIYKNYYGTSGKHRYSYRTTVDSLVSSTDNGLVQLTMDEELMHGSTITITYNIKVTNVGETDYEGTTYYYLGDSSGASKTTTTVNQIVDYVANNLQYDDDEAYNNGWAEITYDDLVSNTSSDDDANLVNNRLYGDDGSTSDTAWGIQAFSTIITYEYQTDTDSSDEPDYILEPGESVERTLQLSQLISTENSEDDLTYENIVEIVKTSNTVGRRMAYSVVGNQDPEEDAAEVDASEAEKVYILPPFGDNAIVYYCLIAIVLVILIVGIVLIIKKVLKKKDTSE